MDSWGWTLLFLLFAFFFVFLEFFFPSGGILAVIAIAALVCSIVFAFLEGITFGSCYAVGILLGIPIFVWYLFRWWPRSFMGRRILLDPMDDPALAPNEELEHLKSLVGQKGIVRSKMMMSGQIDIQGQRYNAISESEALMPGDAVVVIQVDGINILVRKTQPPEPIEPTAPETIEDPFS